MNYLSDLLELFRAGLLTALAVAVGFVKKHPYETVLAVLALLRLLGTTVQTGSKGVLFVFGRVLHAGCVGDEANGLPMIERSELAAR